MKDGNWIAMDKNLAKHFPDRKYSEIEAAFSLTLDYDNNRMVTVSGYAKLWQWSRSKVRNFLETMQVDVVYPEATQKKQKQKGQIKRQKKDRSETEKGQIRMVDTKGLETSKDRKRTEEEQKKDRRKDTTSNPINNPKPKNKYSEDSNEFRIANFLYQNILKNKPDFKKPNLQTWASDADKLLRIDSRNIENVKKLIIWVQNDPFEQSNVLSVSKLRTRFDNLELKMNKKSIKSNQQPGTYKTLHELMNEDEPQTIEVKDYEIS